LESQSLRELRKSKSNLKKKKKMTAQRDIKQKKKKEQEGATTQLHPRWTA